MKVHQDSFLFITLDSCRWDVFRDANIPNIKGIGPHRKTFTQATYTYPAHQSFFMGFLPTDKSGQRYWDSRRSRIFHLVSPTSTKESEAYVKLKGKNIIDGFNRKKYRTLGLGAMGWFNKELPAGKVLTEDFQRFVFTGPFDLERQINIAIMDATKNINKPLFTFINVGETHHPYWHKGAPWDQTNYCMPFGTINNREKCQMRQRGCLEYVDRKIKHLLQVFSNASIIICADHGDVHGEDGLWGHSVVHPTVMTVPMVMKLRKK